VKKSDYAKEEVEAALSVMIELMTLLGAFRDDIVLIGGWVPYFLTGDKKQEHTGSLDLDLALNLKHISNKTYNTILQLLIKAGYEQGPQPFQFYRPFRLKSGQLIRIEVDFLAGEYGGTTKTHRTQTFQDIRARKARGCDLVFESNSSVILTGIMPDGAKNEIRIKIANIVPFLVTKGMALWDNYKEKHAYDIYFVVKNYPRGIEKIVQEFGPFIENRLAIEGLSKIRKKFDSIDSVGPVWIINFMEISDKEEAEQIKRDAFERINALLDALKIGSFRG